MKPDLSYALTAPGLKYNQHVGPSASSLIYHVTCQLLHGFGETFKYRQLPGSVRTIPTAAQPDGFEPFRFVLEHRCTCSRSSPVGRAMMKKHL